MENEHAFEADATVSTFTKVRSTDSRDSRRGHDLVQSAVGGFEAEVRQRSERSPLLGHRRSKSSSASGSSHGHPEDLGNGDGWDGLRDFDGLPWYKTPSVCSTLLYFPRHLMDPRFSGFFRPSSSSPWHSGPPLSLRSTSSLLSSAEITVLNDPCSTPTSTWPR